jgi:hypothetical protein
LAQGLSVAGTGGLRRAAGGRNCAEGETGDRAAAPTKIELPAKGVVPPPRATNEIITKGVSAGGAAGGIGFWDWIVAPPWETTGIALAGAGAIGGALYALNRWHARRQEAVTPIIPPIPAGQRTSASRSRITANT